MHTETIKAAALELFRSHSYSKTAIKDIAHACDLGKGTIYLYFDSKEAILLAIIEDRLAELIAAIDAEFAADPQDWTTRLERFLDMATREYFNLKGLLFGSFDNVESRVLRDVFVRFDKLEPQFESSMLKLIQEYGLAPGTGIGELTARVADYIDLMVGKIIHYTIKNDWNDLAGLQAEIKPLGLRLFRQTVLN